MIELFQSISFFSVATFEASTFLQKYHVSIIAVTVWMTKFPIRRIIEAQSTVLRFQLPGDRSAEQQLLARKEKRF